MLGAWLEAAPVRASADDAVSLSGALIIPLSDLHESLTDLYVSTAGNDVVGHLRQHHLDLMAASSVVMHRLRHRRLPGRDLVWTLAGVLDQMMALDDTIAEITEGA
jgi:hypothetical protein